MARRGLILLAMRCELRLMHRGQSKGCPRCWPRWLHALLSEHNPTLAAQLWEEHSQPYTEHQYQTVSPKLYELAYGRKRPTDEEESDDA